MEILSLDGGNDGEKNERHDKEILQIFGEYLQIALVGFCSVIESTDRDTIADSNGFYVLWALPIIPWT